MPTMSWRSAAERDHLLGEEVGPDAAGRARLAGLDVEGADLVELVGLVALGRVVAEALVGDHVDDHRAAEPLGLGQRLLDGVPVVAVDRADVLQAEVLEHPLRGQGVLHALLHRVQRVVDGRADALHLVQPALDEVEHLLVARVGAQRGEVGGEAADGRLVGAAVVVDDHHQLAVLADRDVVERLPGHAAGERAVADHRDDVAVLAADARRPWPARRRTTGRWRRGSSRRRRGRTRPGWGSPRGRPRCAACRTGWPGRSASCGRRPGGRCPRRRGRAGESKMRWIAERQLDDAEVGAEVAAAGGAGADQLVTDLAGQRGPSWSSVRSRRSAGEVTCSSSPIDVPLVRTRRDPVECRRSRSAEPSRRGGVLGGGVLGG